MGQIKYFVTKKRRNVIFPVTRAEAVITGCTTLDRRLAGIDERIEGLRSDLGNIGRITEVQIDEVVNRNNQE